MQIIHWTIELSLRVSNNKNIQLNLQHPNKRFWTEIHHTFSRKMNKYSFSFQQHKLIEFRIPEVQTTDVTLNGLLL